MNTVPTYFKLIPVLLVFHLHGCQPETSSVSYEKDGLHIQFSELTNDKFRKMRGFADPDYSLIQQSYSSRSKVPHLSITRVRDSEAFELLQTGKREVCTPDFIPGYSDSYRTLPTHTEILNDTTFLLGSLWYSSSDDVVLENINLEDGFGWQASILQPSFTTYINLWHDDQNISLDSLLIWSNIMREGIIISIY